MGYGDYPIPLGDDPIELAPPVTKAEILNMAARAVRQIKVVHKSDYYDLRAWKATAEAMGASVKKLSPSAGQGYYDVANKTIFYNPSGDEEVVAGRIVHELLHHVFVEYKISPKRRGIERYDDHRQTVEHQAACIGQFMLRRDLLGR